MKLTPGVNFTNIFQAVFAPIFFKFAKKLQTQTVSCEKLPQTLLYEKAVCKRLLK